MEICEIEKAVRSIGMYSENAIQRTINQFKSLDYEAIDSEAFRRWFKPTKFLAEGIKNPGSYFIKCVKDELALGTFKSLSEPQSSASSPAAEISSVEDFEKEWDTWCDVIRGLSLNPEMPDSPSLGVLVIDAGNRVRGVSTGDGGFAYIDGTESQRFKKFENLTNQEQEDLCAAVERLHGHLLAKDSILQQMRQLMGGSTV